MASYSRPQGVNWAAGPQRSALSRGDYSRLGGRPTPVADPSVGLAAWQRAVQQGYAESILAQANFYENTVRNASLQMQAANLMDRTLVHMALHEIVAALTQETLAQMNYVKDYADNFNRVLKNRETRFLRMMEKVAAQGRTATIKAYKARVHKYQPYRQGDSGPYKRYSGGAMLRVLEGKDWYRVSSESIVWILPEVFDVAAKQWYRLNFGAQPAPRTSVPTANRMFFGQNIGPGPDLSGLPQSKSFGIPQGVFSGSPFNKTPDDLRGLPGGTGYFYPSGASTSRASKMQFDPGGKKYFAGKSVTKGIVGRRFFDEGIRTINQALPLALELLVYEMASEAEQGARYSFKTYASKSYNYTSIIGDMEARWDRDLNQVQRSLLRGLAETNKRVEEEVLARAFPRGRSWGAVMGQFRS